MKKDELAALQNLKFHEMWSSVSGYQYAHLPEWNDVFYEEEQLGIHNPANVELRVRWINNLRQAVEQFAPKNKSGSPLVSDVDLLTCSLRRRAEALVMTLQTRP